MKKYIYTLVALGAVATLAFSCAKEISDPEKVVNGTEVDSSIPMTIEAVINPDDVETKTQYAGNVTFGWTENDQVRMPVVKWSGENATGSITECNYYTFKTTDASGSTSATFNNDLENYNPNPSGAANTWTSMGYLVYPASLVYYKAYYGSKPGLTLPSSIAYNTSNPLDGGVIPLIGRKDGDTYKFSTAVGIIKLTLSNAPSAAKKIKLVSVANDLAGDFVPTDVDATVSQLQLPASGYGEKVLTLTGLELTGGNTYDFYFPVPVGTYAANDLSISVLDSNDLPLLEKTIAKELTIARNEVLSIPTLLYHRVYVKGSLSNPLLYTENPCYSTGGTIRMIISRDKLTKANYVKANWPETNRSAANQTGWALNSHAAFLQNETGSGLFYLQYIVCTNGTQPNSLSDDNVAIYGSVPFYFAPATNKIPVESSWLDVPYISASEGEDVGYLVDNNTGTYWHSPYGSEDPARNATYGQIISIDLNEGSLTTDGNFYFSFATRNVQNDHAKVLDIYVSNVPWNDAGFDESKVKVGSTANALVGIWPRSDTWVKNPIECTGSGSYRYITVSILNTWGETRSYDLTTAGCTHVAEIEFYTK